MYSYDLYLFPAALRCPFLCHAHHSCHRVLQWYGRFGNYLDIGRIPRYTALDRISNRLQHRFPHRSSLRHSCKSIIPIQVNSCITIYTNCIASSFQGGLYVFDLVDYFSGGFIVYSMYNALKYSFSNS